MSDVALSSKKRAKRKAVDALCDCTENQMERCLRRPEPFHRAGTFDCKARIAKRIAEGRRS